MPGRRSEERRVRLDARAAELQRAVDRERRNRNIVIAAFVVVVLGGGGTLAFLALSSTAGDSLAGYAVPDEGRTHAAVGTALTHQHQPPSSGTHYSQQGVAPLKWGAYRQVLSEGDWIHNLEHGGVVLVYRCAGAECDDLYGKAQDLFRSLPKEATFNEVKFVSLPYQSMPPKVAVLSWGREEDLSMFDARSVLDFYQRNVDHGPESIP